MIVACSGKTVTVDGEATPQDLILTEVDNDLRRFVRAQLNDIRPGRDIDVEDVVQETYLRVWSKDDGTDIQNQKSYLFRTAKNLIIDIGRRRARQPIDFDPSIAVREHIRKNGAVNLTPERHVGAQQDLEIVMKILEELPDNCRRAFTLQRSTGMKYADVAAALGISESMVQKHMARALLEIHKGLPG